MLSGFGHLKEYIFNHSFSEAADFQSRNSSDEEPLSELVKKSKTGKGNTKVTEENMDILNATDTVRAVPKNAINSNDVNNTPVANQDKPDDKDAGTIDTSLCIISMPNIYSRYIKNLSIKGLDFEPKISNPQTQKVQSVKLATDKISRPSSQCFAEDPNKQELLPILKTCIADPNVAGNLQSVDSVAYDDVGTCNSRDDILFLRSSQQTASSQNSKIQKYFGKTQRKRRISSPGLLLKKKSTTKIALTEPIKFNGNSNNEDTCREMCTYGFNITITESKCEGAAPPLRRTYLQNQEHVAVQLNEQPSINVEEPLVDENGNVEAVDITSLPASLSLSFENSTKDFNFGSILRNQEHVAVQLNDQPLINVEEPLMQNAVNGCKRFPFNIETATTTTTTGAAAGAGPGPGEAAEDVSFSASFDSTFLGFDEDEFNATCMRACITEEMQISLKSPANDDSMHTSMNNVNCSIGGKTENEVLFSDDNMRQNNLTFCGNADQFGINYNENEENSNPPEKKTITRETSEANLFCILNPNVNDQNECFTQKLNHNSSEQINDNNDIRINGMNTGLRPPDADCLDSDTDDLHKGSLAASAVIVTIGDELRDETFLSRSENDAQTRECFAAVADHNGKNENIRNHGDDDNELIKDQVNREKEMFADKPTQPPERIDNDKNKKQPPACKSMTERVVSFQMSLLEMEMQLQDELDFDEDDSDDLDVLSLTTSDNIGSPNDDRFSVSAFVEDDAGKVESTNELTAPHDIIPLPYLQSKSIGKKKIYENIVRTIVNDFPSTSKLQQQERQQEQQQDQDQEKQQSLSRRK
uniref:Uncharacterized protein n=1 Tax=Glossina pallidipes TaxID=7398 RepID=A0A1A9Z3W5_GLOPL